LSWARKGGRFKGPDTLRQLVRVGGAQTLRRIVVLAEVLVHLSVLLKEACAASNGAMKRRFCIISLADGVESRWSFRFI
jgi:hypothetical protein